MINSDLKITSLPTELIVHVFSYLSETDLLVLAYTTEYFKEIVERYFQPLVTNQEILDRALSLPINRRNLERVKILVKAGAFPSGDTADEVRPHVPEVLNYFREIRLNKLYEEAENYFRNDPYKKEYLAVIHKVCQEGTDYGNRITFAEDFFYSLKEKDLLSFVRLDKFFGQVALVKYQWKVFVEIS